MNSRRAVLVAAAALVCAYVAVSAVVFVEPQLGSVSRPQAVVVLAGYGQRVQHGLALARVDHIGTIAVSAPAGSPCPKPEPALHVLCFQPDPVSTQGEARAIARLARIHRWRRLLVVAGTTQVERARLRIERCYGGQMAFSPVDPSGVIRWLHEIAYDEAAMVKALVWQRGC